MATRAATAKWSGSLDQGEGSLALSSGSFEGPYTYKSRFEEGEGTNPEELLAAAHAGCFTMALTTILGMGGNPPEALETNASVHMRRGEVGPEIRRISLRTEGRVPGVDEATFKQAAQTAKEVCVISKALAVDDITLEATLTS